MTYNTMSKEKGGGIYDDVSDWYILIHTLFKQ